MKSLPTSQYVKSGGSVGVRLSLIDSPGLLAGGRADFVCMVPLGCLNAGLNGLCMLYAYIGI